MVLYKPLREPYYWYIEMVYSAVQHSAKGPNHMEINVSGLQAAMYALKIKQGLKTEQYKFVKK
ncbi:hypothetical protein ACTJJ0_05785 [Chitinophaga sp. 22321]|uniref:Gfo/Idh/MocA-like oxidoreductase C-terminal domain-containing protein n=1 Tax=Chitinophaga hostae TaxID=2831022 RepID=A0ABS5J0Y9_9BACT|nr:hypothetical protein [Chitinophaga hostae]MBS0028232.1 hypothetical protein [Chitinophaga hostae]